MLQLDILRVVKYKQLKGKTEYFASYDHLENIMIVQNIKYSIAKNFKGNADT